MMSWDLNTATLLAIAIQIGLSIVFVIRLEGRANGAAEKAKDAHRLATEAHEKIAVVTASLSLHREQVAKEYIDRESLHQFKEEVMGALKELSRRIDEVLKFGNPAR